MTGQATLNGTVAIHPAKEKIWSEEIEIE